MTLYAECQCDHPKHRVGQCPGCTCQRREIPNTAQNFALMGRLLKELDSAIDRGAERRGALSPFAPKKYPPTPKRYLAGRRS